MLAAVVALFLVIILGLFVPRLQGLLRSWFFAGGSRILLVPAALTGVFAMVLAARGAWNWPFLAVVAVYTAAPTLLVASSGPKAKRPRWADFLSILLLWLPLEFYTGKDLIPRAAWGIANVTAHGTAVSLALFLFLIYRDLPGIKYNAPRDTRDLTNPLIGFAVAAPLLIALGLAVGFMGPFRAPEPFNAFAFGLLFLKTLVGVGIPEELLFRGLIQNWLTQRFGDSNTVLLGAAAIFGAAHLNNAPAPNWRYMLLATIAGFIYGKVFQRSSTILSSASLHALVNTVRHTFFG
ncbi:MAG TPA: CPBP family intramembrane glutamic endopeptidase [Bryobacteraceae bacterium]|nr:CPBP family intramembrane glutamic endopeptidase [Bryobacteraceae bacterium]